MQDEAYDIAVQNYKALLDQYPFDPNAEEAELKIAEAYFNAERYPEAIAAFGDFERMHPTSDYLPSDRVPPRHGVPRPVPLERPRPAGDQERARVVPQHRRPLPRHAVGRRAPSCASASAARTLAEHDADIAAFYLQRGSLRAAESRLRGLLTDYPDTDATADALDTFAKLYAARDEPEEANLALATLVALPPRQPARRDARQQLGALDPAQGQDPLPDARRPIDAMRTQADREKVPRPSRRTPIAPACAGRRPLLSRANALRAAASCAV